MSALPNTAATETVARRLDALLPQSAALARVIAPLLCISDEGKRCCAYHGVWQYLRIVGLTRTLERQRSFYHETLGKLARVGGYRRVLVCGSADYALPAYCAAAYQAAGVEANLTVLDRCPTPLVLCRWQAALTGQPLATQLADILQWRHSAERFDVVCSHSFLGRFKPQQHPALLSVWRHLLHPGGKLLTATRLRGEHRIAADGRYSASQIEALRNHVVALAQDSEVELDIPAEQLGDMAVAYARQVTDYPIVDARALAELFERAGFRVDNLTVDEAAANARTPAMKGEPATWLYATLQATRL